MVRWSEPAAVPSRAGRTVARSGTAAIEGGRNGADIASHRRVEEGDSALPDSVGGNPATGSAPTHGTGFSDASIGTDARDPLRSTAGFPVGGCSPGPQVGLSSARGWLCPASPCSRGASLRGPPGDPKCLSRVRAVDATIRHVAVGAVKWFFWGAWKGRCEMRPAAGQEQR